MFHVFIGRKTVWKEVQLQQKMMNRLKLLSSRWPCNRHDLTQQTDTCCRAVTASGWHWKTFKRVSREWEQPHSGYQKPGRRAWFRICTYPSAPVNVPGGGLRLKWERRKGDMERCMTGRRSVTVRHHSQHLLAGNLALQVPQHWQDLTWLHSSTT